MIRKNKYIIKWKFFLEFKNNNEYYFITFRELTKLPSFINIIGKLNFFILSSFILPLFFTVIIRDALSILFTIISMIISFMISFFIWSFNYFDRIINFYLFCRNNNLLDKNNKVVNHKFIKVINNKELLKYYCFIKHTTWKTYLSSLFVLSLPIIIFLTVIIINFE